MQPYIMNAIMFFYSLVLQLIVNQSTTAFFLSMCSQSKHHYHPIQLRSTDVTSRRSMLSTATTIVKGACTLGTCVGLPRESSAFLTGDSRRKYVILNEGRVEPIRNTERKPLDVVERVQILWSQLESNYSQDGLIDYVAISDDKEFLTIEREIANLRNMSLNHIDTSTKIALIINLYNVLIKIAFATVGIPKSDLSRYIFFDSVGINIGGNVFSFNDLENGILRANSIAPYHINKPFEKGDEREGLSLINVDPRIHFALNCGAKSCPPVRRYTSEGLEEELQASALDFCASNSNVLIDEQKRELYLSKIFKWYMTDFAISSKELPYQILRYLTGEKKKQMLSLIKSGNVKVLFFDYDWTTNERVSKTFD